MSLEDLNIKIKDVVQLAIYIIGGTMFFIGISNKVDSLEKAVNEIKSEKKEVSNDDKLIKQQLQNQINATSLQVELLKQDVQMIKEGYYPINK
jgi:archaellum component FlaC